MSGKAIDLPPYNCEGFGRGRPQGGDSRHAISRRARHVALARSASRPEPRSGAGLIAGTPRDSTRPYHPFFRWVSRIAIDVSMDAMYPITIPVRWS